MKFKEGDKVKVVDFADNHFMYPNPVGLVGVIRKTQHPGQHPYLVDFSIPPEDADTYPALFGESELEALA